MRCLQGPVLGPYALQRVYGFALGGSSSRLHFVIMCQWQDVASTIMTDGPTLLGPLMGTLTGFIP